MAATVTLNDALQIFGKLSAEDQDMMLEIARRQRIESWRKESAAYGRKAMALSRAGKLKSYTAEELIARLSKQWEDPVE